MQTNETPAGKAPAQASAPNQKVKAEPPGPIFIMADDRPILVRFSQRKPGGPWWYSFRVGARRVFESSHLHDPKAAEDWARKVVTGAISAEKTVQDAKASRDAPGTVSFHVPGEKKRVRVVLSKRKLGGPWWYSFYWRNRKIFRSSGSNSEREARAAARAAVLDCYSIPLEEQEQNEGRLCAKARDAWMESEEGQNCAADQAAGQYLRNRLARAFVAGWNAGRAKDGQQRAIGGAP